MKILFFFFMISNICCHAEVWLDGQWGEGMTLLGGKKITLNGVVSKAGEKVSVTYRDKTYEGEGNSQTRWNIEIDPGEPGGPFAMTIKSSNSIDLKSVYVADLILGPVLGDGMVIQRGEKAPIYGTSILGQKINVNFRNKNYETSTDDKGKWSVNIEPGEAGGPFPMTIKGKSSIELNEVYVGEVWVCSGQSNMVMGVNETTNANKLALDAPNTQLRLQMWSDNYYTKVHPPLAFLGWQQADKKSIMAFCGTGYYFGAALQAKLKIPVGLIQCAHGNTAIEAFMPATKVGNQNFQQGGVYTWIKNIQPFAIRGVIWYQGESDAVKGKAYQDYCAIFSALIEGWRKDWGQGNFPFLLVQLPRIGVDSDSIRLGKKPTPEQGEISGYWSSIREQQRNVLSRIANTAMVVYYEHTTGVIHPPEKIFAGERLALAARAVAYGEKIEYSGPQISSASLTNNTITLTFSHADGLIAKDGDLRQFEVQTKGQESFTPAKAQIIDGGKVQLEISKMELPIVVRYAYREWPDGNLFNAAGLPASPFVTEIK